MMKTFILSRDVEVWKIIVNRFHKPTIAVGNSIIPKPEEDWNDQDMRMIKLNATTKNKLGCALNPKEYN